ncbi:MAG: ABC transporter permease [Candidatus Alcyoniella australis]|nr:ABC transporter permease [Candidatus Alcyoniella australis]
MDGVIDIKISSLIAGYSLLLIPLGVILFMRVPIFGRTLIALVRMTVQLLFVGLYLQVIFRLNNPWLNSLWVLVMIVVADISIARGSGLRLRRFALPLFISLLVGTAVPLLFFLGPILRRPNLLDAQYAIPIAGMILGNCLRADIVGIKSFYDAVRRGDKAYLNTLAQGASLKEALGPYMRDAIEASLAPTVATIATIGLVALPGMMTGVILGGADPMVAIKYQIAIMIAIFSGTSLTVLLALLLTGRSSFNGFGVLDRALFKD